MINFQTTEESEEKIKEYREDNIAEPRDDGGLVGWLTPGAETVVRGTGRVSDRLLRLGGLMVGVRLLGLYLGRGDVSGCWGRLGKCKTGGL